MPPHLSLPHLDTTNVPNKKITREDREDRDLRGTEGYKGKGAGAGAAAENVGRRLYVGNLAFRTSWQGLKDHFKSKTKVTPGATYSVSENMYPLGASGLVWSSLRSRPGKASSSERASACRLFGHVSCPHFCTCCSSATMLGRIRRIL